MNVTLPLTIEQLKQTIAEDNAEIVVDISNSKIKGKAALVYLSNLDLGNVSFDRDKMTYEEKRDLLIEYVKLKNILKLDQLLKTNLQALFYKRCVDAGFDLDHLIIGGILSTAAEAELLFADVEYDQALLQLNDVLESLPYFIMTLSNQFKADTPDYMNSFDVINDVNYTGFTFVNYVQDVVFQHHYYTNSRVSQKPKYFKVQFDDYIYKGKSLGSYFATNNMMLPMIGMIKDGILTPETLKLHEKELSDATSS